MKGIFTDKLCDTEQFHEQLQLIYRQTPPTNLVVVHQLKGAKASNNKNLAEH
jgi:hypothetical protein